MTAPVTVSERDLRTLLGIVTDDRGDLPAAGLPDSLLADLMNVVRCDVVAFFGLDSGREAYWFGQDVPAKDLSGAQGFWVYYWDCPFLSYPDRSGDLRSVTKISDWYSARQWHSSGLYCDYLRAQETEHMLALCLPAGAGPHAGPGGPSGWPFSAGTAGTSPSVTARCWHCCVPTCTGPTWTRNGAATPRLS